MNMYIQMNSEKINQLFLAALIVTKFSEKIVNFSHIMCNSSFLKGFRKDSAKFYIDRASVCGKSLQLKNALLLWWSMHTQAKVDDVTRPCALGLDESRRAVKHVESERARDFYAHMDMPSLHTKTLWLSVWRRVLGASLEAVNVFSAWIWRRKTSSIFPLNFQYVALYISFNNLR